MPDKSDMKQKVLQLYEQRINRYRERLSAMYPDNGCVEAARFSQIRTTSMMDVLSYMSVPSQLELKKVNRYFLKLVKIAQTDVSVNALDGWIDAIHLSTFLKRLVIAGERGRVIWPSSPRCCRTTGFCTSPRWSSIWWGSGRCSTS